MLVFPASHPFEWALEKDFITVNGGGHEWEWSPDDGWLAYLDYDETQIEQFHLYRSAWQRTVLSTGYAESAEISDMAWSEDSRYVAYVVALLDPMSILEIVDTQTLYTQTIPLSRPLNTFDLKIYWDPHHFRLLVIGRSESYSSEKFIFWIRPDIEMGERSDPDVQTMTRLSVLVLDRKAIFSLYPVGNLDTLFYIGGDDAFYVYAVETGEKKRWDVLGDTFYFRHQSTVSPFDFQGEANCN